MKATHCVLCGRELDLRGFCTCCEPPPPDPQMPRGGGIDIGNVLLFLLTAAIVLYLFVCGNSQDSGEMDDMEETKFRQWAKLEIMGHQTYAGLVSEQSIGGASFVRVDIPGHGDVQPLTKIFGGSSVYCITPCTEELARMLAASYRHEEVSIYDVPREIREAWGRQALPPAEPAKTDTDSAESWPQASHLDEDDWDDEI